MKKFVKIFLTFILVLFVTCVCCYAVDINTNFSDNSPNSTNSSFVGNIGNSPSENFSTNPSISTYVEDSEPTYKMSTSSTSEDFHLTVSDIIDIILISVGVVIILLAIAILIRLKNI